MLEITAKLEAAGYRHNDLHPENWLVEGDDAATLRLIDLGRVSRTDARTARSRIEFAAPERRAGGGTSGVAADVYTVGGVIFTMLTGQLPPRNVDGRDRHKGVSEQQVSSALAAVEGLSDARREALGAFLRRALRTKPENRYASFREMGAALADAARTP
jgi:serine/threonine protein kinase